MSDIFSVWVFIAAAVAGSADVAVCPVPFSVHSPVRGFSGAGCDTRSAGFTMAGGSSTTGTWTVSLPSVKLCHCFVLPKVFLDRCSVMKFCSPV